MHWNWLAALGNSALILPLLAIVLALLAMRSPDGRRDARRWLLSAVLAFAAMALTKIAFYGWGIGLHAVRLASPSGHAALAMAFWPVFLALLAPASRREWRSIGVTVGFALGVVCTVSRVATGAHTVSEAVVGASVGAMVALATLRDLRSEQLAVPGVALIGALLLGAGLLVCGRPPQPPTERWLADVGAHLAGCDAPVSKREWLRTGAVVDEPQPRR